MSSYQVIAASCAGTRAVPDPQERLPPCPPRSLGCVPPAPARPHDAVGGGVRRGGPGGHADRSRRVAGPRRRPARHVHERVRLLRRQRRHPRAAPGPRQRAARPGADRRRLRPHVLAGAGHRRAARRPLRAPSRLRHRDGGVHAGLGRVRAGADERHPGRRPPRPGGGGGDDGPPGAVDHPGELPGAGTARRPRPLRDDDRRRTGQRPGPRRDPAVGQHRRPELAAHLPRQRARGDPHGRFRLPSRSGIPLPRPARPRSARRWPAHARRRAADHPGRRGRRPRLAAVVLALAGRRAGGGRRVRVVGTPGPRGPAAPPAPHRPRPLPVQGFPPRAFRERHAVRDDQLLLLRPRPVPPDGTRRHPPRRRADVRAPRRGELRREPVERHARGALRPQHADRRGGAPGERPARAPRGGRPRAAHRPRAGRGDAVRIRAGTADPPDHRRGAEPRPGHGLGSGGRRARHRPADVGDHRPHAGGPRVLRGRGRRASRRVCQRLPGGVRVRPGARARLAHPVPAAVRPGRAPRVTPEPRRSACGRRGAAPASGRGPCAPAGARPSACPG